MSDFQFNDEQQFDQQDREANSNLYENQDEGQYPEHINYTQMPQIFTYRTQDRYFTLMETEPNTKNVPKTLGNNFRKFMEKIKQERKDQFQELPPEMDEFLNKKKTGQQSNYKINDFKELFKNEVCKQWFIFYMKYFAFLDLISSNRIEKAEEQIHFIEQYLAGAQQPDQFCCNRNSTTKNKQKKKKEEQKQIEIIHQVVQNSTKNQQEEKIADESHGMIQIQPNDIMEEKNWVVDHHHLLRKDSFEQELESDLNNEIEMQEYKSVEEALL